MGIYLVVSTEKVIDTKWFESAVSSALDSDKFFLRPYMHKKCVAIAVHIIIDKYWTANKQCEIADMQTYEGNI